MKKVSFILFIGIILSSCSGEDGKDGISTNWYNSTYTITSYDWRLSGVPNSANSYYYADIPVSKLTNEIFKYGAVVTYLETDDDVKNAMPYVLHKGLNISYGMEKWTQT